MAETPTVTTGAPSTTNALSVASFRYLWMNTITFFMVGNGLRFLYGWVVLDGLSLGVSAEFWQGFVVFVFGVPSFFLLVPAGVWADRRDPKQMLMATQIGLFMVMVVTAVLIGSGGGSLGLLVISAALAGAAIAVGQPVRNSLVPALLPGNLLYSGIALNAIAVTLSLVVGAVSAKIVGDWFGFDGAFWWMAVLMGFGVLILGRLVSPGPATEERNSTMLQSTIEGVSFVWNERGIRPLFALLSVSGLLMTPLMFVTMQAHIKEELGRSAGDAAPVFALMGLGIAASSVAIMRRGNIANKSVLFLRAMTIGCICLALMGRTTAYWQLLPLGLALGTCGGIFINMNQGLIQANTPAPVMGRVMGLYALVQNGMVPVGALILGVAATAVGTGATLTAGGLVGLCVVLFISTTSSAIRQIN